MNKEYYEEHKEHIREYQRKYREEHKKYVRERDRKYYRKHREECLKRTHKYRHSIKGQIANRNSHHRRRALEKKDAGITNQQWNKLLRQYNFRCAYCGVQENMTMDHVIPLSKGGKHLIENIVPACASCNSRKHTKLGWSPKIFKAAVGE